MRETAHRDPLQDFVGRIIAELALNLGYGHGPGESRSRLSIPSEASGITASTSFLAWICALFQRGDPRWMWS